MGKKNWYADFNKDVVMTGKEYLSMLFAIGFLPFGIVFGLLYFVPQPADMFKSANFIATMLIPGVVGYVGWEYWRNERRAHKKDSENQVNNIDK